MIVFAIPGVDQNSYRTYTIYPLTGFRTFDVIMIHLSIPSLIDMILLIVLLFILILNLILT